MPDGAASFDIDDDGVVEIDRVVGRVGEEGMTLQGSSPLCRWIGPWDELRLHLAGRTPGRLVERVEILPDRPPGFGESGPVDLLRALGGALLVRIRLDQAGIDGETLTTHQAFLDAAPDGRLEQFAQEITVTEAAMPVLREGRVVGHIALQPEPAEPAIGQVEMNFLAKAPLRADAEAIADEQNPDHQLRVDRGSAGLAVQGSQMCAEAGQVDEPVDGSNKVTYRDAPLEAELVEQRLLHHRPFAHHQRILHPRDN